MNLDLQITKDRVDTVAVCIASYGGTEWIERAQGAIDSVEAQSVDVSWYHCHQSTVNGEPARSLGDIRNNAAHIAREKLANLKYLVFLDADDTLAVDYIEKMLEGTGDIRQPSTRGVRESDGVEDPYPVLIPRRRLIDQNFIVIGAMLNTNLFFQVGGFDDYAMIEDWELFLRMYIAGAEITACPEAIYKVTVRENSRNQSDQTRLYNEIRNKHLSAFEKRGWK